MRKNEKDIESLACYCLDAKVFFFGKNVLLGKSGKERKGKERKLKRKEKEYSTVTGH